MRTLATNRLGHFLLTNLLLNLLEKSGQSRIVNVASDTHKSVRTIPWDDLQGETSYRPLAAYNLTKLMNVLFTYGMARRLAGKGVTANALHPGWPIRTDLDRDARGAFALSSKVSKFSPFPRKRELKPQSTLPVHPRLPTLVGATT
ncbi:MAG: SDR family NAD(P)-dependent oxidoreductase [Rubrobacteraceae bacterium]